MEREYYVELPITGYVHGEVKAHSEKEALRKFENKHWNLELHSSDSTVDLGEVDVYEDLMFNGELQTYHTKALVEGL